MQTRVKRCPWPSDDPLMISYHDKEWGVPLHDDKKLYEFIVLEGHRQGFRRSRCSGNRPRVHGRWIRSHPDYRRSSHPDASDTARNTALGSEWKKAVARYYNRAFTMSTSGGVLSYRDNYLDIDPTYRDAYGLPMVRLTFDWRENELKRIGFLTEVAVKIAKAMNPSKFAVAGTGWYGTEEKKQVQHYSIVPCQTTHNTGGAIMGADPKTSVVNKYLQSWDVPNLFVVGTSAFPQKAGYNPTGTVRALAYWTAEAIKKKYLRSRDRLCR
jgi:choline dehydrogenase-like flavoprotein